MKTGITITKNIALTVMMLFMMQHAVAQRRQKSPVKYITGFETSLSGGGHGAFYVPTVGIEIKRNTFTAGPIIQKRSGISNGFKISYSRNLSAVEYTPNDRDLLQVNFFSAFQYNDKLPLGYGEVKYQDNIYSNTDRDWNAVKLSTAELNIGFQLQVNITNNISWKSYVSGCGYHYINYVKLMDRSQTGVVLTVGTGIAICIN
jgi:hypothetical protein